VPLRVDRHAGAFAEVQVGRQLEEGDRVERDFRDALRPGRSRSPCVPKDRAVLLRLLL
jgi:hypothetical protein